MSYSYMEDVGSYKTANLYMKKSADGKTILTYATVIGPQLNEKGKTYYYAAIG